MISKPARRKEIIDWSLLAFSTLIVFSTLSFVRALFDRIVHAGLENMLRLSIVSLLAALAVVLVLWLIWFAKVRSPLVYLQTAGIFAAYAIVLMTLSEMPVERIHLMEYGVLGCLAHRALRHRCAGRERFLLAVLITLNLGLGDELIQGLLPRRFYDPKDVMVNAVSGLLGVLVATIIARTRINNEQ